MYNTNIHIYISRFTDMAALVSIILWLYVVTARWLHYNASSVDYPNSPLYSQLLFIISCCSIITTVSSKHFTNPNFFIYSSNKFFQKVQTGKDAILLHIWWMAKVYNLGMSELINNVNSNIFSTLIHGNLVASYCRTFGIWRFFFKHISGYPFVRLIYMYMPRTSHPIWENLSTKEKLSKTVNALLAGKN